MNRTNRTKFEAFIRNNLNRIRFEITSGEGRSRDAREANYHAIYGYLQEAKIDIKSGDVEEAAPIIGTALNRVVEVSRPPEDGGAERKLHALLRDSSGVTIDSAAVYVQLDNDQLKHQPPNAPIGTRQTHGGTKFGVFATADWHRNHTMVYMREWARELGEMREGQAIFHGQAQIVDDIHYEGFCLYAQDKKYVSFHCYPEPGSHLALGR